MIRVRNAVAVAAATVVLAAPVALALPAQADSPNAIVGFGRLFYDGSVVRTVATPAGSPGNGVDAIYPIVGGAAGQLPVTSAAPGDNYHGGRWAVNIVTWNVTPYLLTSDEAVTAASMAGHVTITRNPGADFVCPVAGKV